jgi:hypothetical protein
VVHHQRSAHAARGSTTPSSAGYIASACSTGLILPVDYASPGHILIIDTYRSVLWVYGPASGGGMLDDPSLAFRLNAGFYRGATQATAVSCASSRVGFSRWPLIVRNQSSRELESLVPPHEFSIL